MTRTVPASTRLLDAVLDPGSYRSWDRPPTQPDTGDDYRRALESARDRAGTDEAVVTGEGRIDGRRIAVVCGEFTFLGGSVGVAAAGRILAAVDRATAEGLPLLAAPASGGTRMQEGTPAFLRMAAISAAVTEHTARGLPYLVYLRHPTTGGVFASWGSLGQLTFAEPGALVGFLGPKVYAALHGERFPEGVQTAENLHEHGLVDAVVPVAELGALLGRVLRTLPAGPRPTPSVDAPARVGGPVPRDAWASVTATRRPDRPGLRELLALASDPVFLDGDGEGARGAAVVVALTRFGGTSCVLVGQDRGVTQPLGPADLRTARRGMRLAAQLRLPLVTVVDTPGAGLSAQAEEGGLAGQIARCLADLTTLPVPTLAVLLGQGSGGAALAFLPADRVLAAADSWLSPLPPEGASAIVHGTTDHAAEMAAAQRIHSGELTAQGVVDRIVEGPADGPDAFVERIAAAIRAELRDLASPTDARRARLRSWGTQPG